MMEPDDFLEVAVRAAQDAGRQLLQMFASGRRAAEAKGGQSHNYVTEADLASEELIVSTIRERFPKHDILAEERGGSAGQSEYLWVVDPLDATNNFAHGLPHFAVSIALYHKQRPLLGVVYDPSRGELFRAGRGQGAFLNDGSIAVSNAATLPESLLITGFYYERGELMRRTLAQIERLFDSRIVGIRRTGCASLDLCYVACGRVDGFWELKLAPWDYAAGALVVTEAGGAMSDTAGRERDLQTGSVLATNGRIHDALRQVLAGEQ